MDGSPVKMRLRCERMLVRAIGFSTIVAATWLTGPPAHAEEAEWIWANGSNSEQSIAVGSACYFRKAINLRVPAEA
ncbi:MAG: hypothetical protein AAF802_31050, partial [Planctomycetota bacterium]